jgi:hypothetical protein
MKSPAQGRSENPPAISTLQQPPDPDAGNPARHAAIPAPTEEVDAPQIDPGNSLRFKLLEIGEKDRVDVILTNPPFGGEEEKGIQGNFPEDRQTAETTLLFLQLIMRKLRQPYSSRGGRWNCRNHR